MTSRRRARRDRRRKADHPEPARRSPEASAKRRQPDRRRDFDASQARIKRTRSWVGVLGFIPLGISLFCAPGGAGPCSIPREIYLAIWAAIFGTFLGLTVRLWREKRAFEREVSAA